VNSNRLQQCKLPVAAPGRVLACGAWLKNTACLIEGHTVWCSSVHGDLSDPVSRLALLASVARLEQQATGPIEAVAHDLHPDFFSTEVALQLAHRLGVPAIGVQHHHAHIALMQAEQGLRHPVIGLALDGVGLGTDQTAWGGELLWVDGAHFERLAHLPSLRLPGGDVAAREPWRMAASALHRLGRAREIVPRLNAMVRSAAADTGVSEFSARGVETLLQRDLNCPVTTSAGRWFDAVAGLLGVCVRQNEEAQAAMALEKLAAQWLAEYPAPLLDAAPAATDLNLDDVMLRLLALCDHVTSDPMSRQAVQAEGAALFHATLAARLASAAVMAAKERHISTVALGGGCFFNRILRDRVSDALTRARLHVCLPNNMNFGDAGLALGQAWVAAQTLHPLRAANSGNPSRKSLCV
jgi:hydrogenase maturation protein HypF